MGGLAAQDATQAPSINEDLETIRREFTKRLSPTEASLLQRVQVIERELIEQRSPWLQPPVILALIVASAGWCIALYQYYGNRSQRTWELLIESLRWFEGGTQPRSIGIALVESKWQYHEEFRSRWASILVNQAIYLLTRKNSRDAAHERANLYRVMDLLTKKVGPGGYIAEIEHEIIGETLASYNPASDRGLINLDPDRFKSWKEYFSADQSKQCNSTRLYGC
jgi:hypothetical protein